MKDCVRVQVEFTTHRELVGHCTASCVLARSHHHEGCLPSSVDSANVNPTIASQHYPIAVSGTNPLPTTHQHTMQQLHASCLTAVTGVGQSALPIVHVLAGLLHDPVMLAYLFGCRAGRERVKGDLVPHTNAVDLPNHRPRKEPKVSVKHFLVDIGKRNDLVIGWQPATQGILNLAQNFQQTYFPPKRKSGRQNGPGPNDRIMYSQGPSLPSGGLLRGRLLAPAKIAPAASPRRDVIPVTQPPIPLSRPRPYPSFSSYPLPESSDPLTLHQLSTTSQLEVVTTTAPTRHYTHFNRLDAVSFNKQVGAVVVV